MIDLGNHADIDLGVEPGVGLAIGIVWFGLVSLALVACALIERRARLASLRDRPEWAPPRAVWGFDSEPPPASYLALRALAAGARMIRSRSRVVDRSRAQRAVGRCLSLLATASALSLVPFAGTWGGRDDGLALVAVDLQDGLLALVFLLMLMAMAQVAIGLSDRSVWSRLASVRLASQSLAGVGLLVLVLAPLVLENGSLRLHDLAFAQQRAFSPFAWLPDSLAGGVFEFVDAWPWPNWNLFAQPLTALLFIPAIVGLTARPWVEDAVSGHIATSGFGLDSDPADLYWGRVEARLARVLFVSLFVSLFLGAGAIPFVPAAAIVDFLEPFIGPALAAGLVAVVQIAAFSAKWLLVLVAASFLQRATATLRGEHWIEVVTARLWPLAGANLLLMSALMLLSDALQGGA